MMNATGRPMTIASTATMILRLLLHMRRERRPAPGTLSGALGPPTSCKECSKYTTLATIRPDANARTQVLRHGIEAALRQPDTVSLPV
jgi:hypothetical protein